MTYTYNNKGTCSVRTVVELNDDHTIKSVQILGGCDGNLKGIAKLLPGMKPRTPSPAWRHRPVAASPPAAPTKSPRHSRAHWRRWLIKVSRGGFHIRPGRLRQPHTLRAHIECAPTFCPQGLLL